MPIWQKYKIIEKITNIDAENEYFCNVFMLLSKMFRQSYVMRITKNVLTILLLWLSLFAAAQNVVVPKYEYRAVWLTTIENLDWPSTPVRRASDIPVQKAELVNILDSLEAMHVNTVLLQTRVRGDVIYPSNIEPFSALLTGVPGKDPGYDPLAFAIEECHKRGMHLHAWLVTLPLGKDEYVAKQGRLSTTRRKRSLCTHYKGAWYLEPGNPEVVDYITDIVTEVVTNYDVDGIHLDYVRYPDRTNGYPDAALHSRYGRGKSLAAWRRSNITRIVDSVYTCVKALKPWVRVSSAPLGKYDDLTRYSSLGWNAHDAVYQEAQAWMRDGIMDILFPMLYYNGNHFYPFVLDWQENAHGRHIVPGIGVYRLLPEYGGWPSIEIERQLNTSRSAGTAGTAMFRTAHILDSNSSGYAVYSKVYRTQALVPPMDWAGDAPSAPSGLVAVRDDGGVQLQWNAVEAVEGFPAVRYNIYAALGDSVSVDNPANIVAVAVGDTCFRWNCRVRGSVALAVTAVNAYGIESAPQRVVCNDVETSILFGDLQLPEPTSYGWRMVVFDVYGRVIYSGRYSTKVIVSGLQRGQYLLKVFNRHGEQVYTKQFSR